MPNNSSKENKEVNKKRRVTTDEKIQQLIQWSKKYPKIKISEQISENVLKEYIEKEEEYKIFLEEYKKIKSYYKYIVNSKLKNILTKEQISKCKEANIGEVFGYSTEIEELAKKYGQSEKVIDYIVRNFETVDNFNELYKKGELKKEDFTLVGSIVDNVLDIDFNSNSNRYDSLYRAIMRIQSKDKILGLYSSEKLYEMIQKHLTPKEQYIVKERFGLISENLPRSEPSLAKEMGVTTPRIHDLIETQALHKLRMPHIIEEYSYDLNKIKKGILTKEEIEIIKNFEEKLYFSEFVEKENLKYNKINDRIKMEDNREAFSLIKNIKQTIRERKIKENTIKRKNKIIPIEEMEFSIRTEMVLRRASLNTLEKISKISLEKLSKIRNITQSSMYEIIYKLEEYGITLAEKDEISELESARKTKDNLGTQETQLKEQIQEAKEIIQNHGEEQKGEFKE